MQDSLFPKMPQANNLVTVQVAVPRPVRQYFDYLAPKHIADTLLPGSRVKVPFGRQQLIGVVLNTGQVSQFDINKLKLISEVIEPTPCLPEDIVELQTWMSRYYQYPIGEVFSHALPALLRQGKAAVPATEARWQLTASGKSCDLETLKRAVKQRQIMSFLQQADAGKLFTGNELNQQWDNWRDAMGKLQQKNLVKQSQQNALFAGESKNQTAPLHPLNTEQQQAAEKIIAALGQHHAFVLEGITGSGKTEVYMTCIADVIERGQQVLVLVPEIGLTPQLVERFKRHLKANIAVLHSSMNDTERLNNWLAAKNFKHLNELNDSDQGAAVLIGTRSAVFAPFSNLGLILIDEEHDLSLKQQDGLRYSAKDVAIMRARNAKVPIVLGSATPSLETLYNVKQKRFTRLALNQRAGEAILPDIHLLDVRSQKLDNGLSAQLIQRMREHLQHGNQVLLFLNRRGFAPVLMCYECGWLSNCPRCDANFTLHQKAHRLRCHHCGSEQAIPPHCPDCLAEGHNNELKPIGMGTERVEEALGELFADKTILRIDRDSTRKKGELEKRLEQAKNKQADILLGTQMLAKGHHFPHVTLVGILSADQGLYSADFRASERMGQLILQVAGRAGREKQKGEVIIQTCHPENPLLIDLQNHSYPAFCKDLFTERQQAMLPPFSYHILIRAEAIDEMAPIEFLNAARQNMTHIETGIVEQVEIFGPFPAPMTRRAGRYRYQMLCQADNRNHLQQLLHYWLPLIESLPNRKKVRWSVDVDPQEMF